MKRPKNRDYVMYLRKSLQSLLPVPFTDENVHLVEDVSEAIRCIEIVYGVGAGEEELVKRRLKERKLTENELRNITEYKGEKRTKNCYCNCESTLAFLIGFQIGFILLNLVYLLLKLV